MCVCVCEREREEGGEGARADLLARLHDMYITTIQVLLSFQMLRLIFG